MKKSLTSTNQKHHSKIFQKIPLILAFEPNSFKLHLFQILTHYECITYTYYTTTTYNIIIPNQSTFCYCPLIYWLKYLESPRITRVLLCRFSLSPKDWKDLHTNRLLLFSLKQEVKGDNNSIGKKYDLTSSIHRSYAYSRMHWLRKCLFLGIR